MRRLHWQVQATVVGTLVLFALMMALAWTMVRGDEADPDQRLVAALASISHSGIAAADAKPSEQQGTLERLARETRADLTLRTADGLRIASVGPPLPFVPDGAGGARGRRHGPPSLVVQLADGRWLLAAPSVRHRPLGLAMTLVLGFVAVALGSVPVVRRTTRRLERLEQRVEQLGTGDLSARVEVEGNDEIARLAAAFNQAASRIERLVAAQRTLLASASHELRSPLARIRVAIDLMHDGGAHALHADVVRDIGVLDALIEELLLASRLEGFATPLEGEDVDLLAIAAEECAAADATLDGVQARVQGDPRLLRHLVRNLLQNARRYAGNTAVDVTLARIGGSFVLSVDDRGPGVPEHERERIFEPFRRLPGTREGAGGGVGLGLALVARIAVLHGGQARCLARPGGGSRFEVQLPAGGVSRAG